jgi:small-conductance mechanosensitive channel
MEWLTSALTSLRIWLDWLPNPVVALIILGVALAVALILHLWLQHLARRLLAARYPVLFSSVTQVRGVTRLALLIIAMIVAVRVAPLPPDIAYWLTHLLGMGVVGLVGWTALIGLQIAADLYLRRFRIDTEDNLLARKHLTQVRVLLRTLDVLIIIITIGAALMTFDAVRQYGYSLFASAGVAGIVVGLAARPLLSNLFAGVQLAMTQPIRIQDVVIVEGEWGIIEEITSTYVVVRIWDLRRLIVPLTYFIEKPFQNWTRETSSLIGVVYFYLDYRAPIGAIRDKLNELVENSKDWNGQTVSLQVTDAKESTIEVRATMSANSAGQAWSLRCAVREQMIDFLQREHPEALPRQRNELAASGTAGQLAHQAGEPIGARPPEPAKPAAAPADRAGEK